MVCLDLYSCFLRMVDNKKSLIVVTMIGRCPLFATNMLYVMKE